MKLRILGAGGHAKVALEAWRSAGGEVVALYDDRETLRGSRLLGIEVAGPLSEAAAPGDSLHIAVGDNAVRARIAAPLAHARFPAVIDAASRVSLSAGVGAGALVCAGAVIQAQARVGRHVIVNSLALVEHDADIADFAHIAPGARLGGAVAIGEGALIGIGAVLLPGVRIGAGAVVGGGAVVIRDVADGLVVAGNPARPVGGA